MPATRTLRSSIAQVAERGEAFAADRLEVSADACRLVPPASDRRRYADVRGQRAGVARQAEDIEHPLDRRRGIVTQILEADDEESARERGLAESRSHQVHAIPERHRLQRRGALP